MEKRYYKVFAIGDKCFRVKAEQHYAGLFANNEEWQLYYRDEHSTFASWNYIGKCATSAQIGETIRINIDGVKRIDTL